ncbi:hypothetical protein [Burkholderia cepacia]|uniref:hypothetical protein n=1 Tax=Burkholderia cepacia TaxID=292 RepID=UPI001C9359A6|nr:hypothetical protein [Burkholderia cepacia]MBY4709154.1 hypothetical protein [Burkholderia cepacia]MBY4736221.1 hypothetical protein [Burkholderia cepacia]MBY4743285.1 hypothetical protein [Burkholderia cepacia]MBY4756277.1 hypothetical protein [Burkholderia cepacia]MBY4774341.1 hypothetical protein [Burkholderia cepacia]
MDMATERQGGVRENHYYAGDYPARKAVAAAMAMAMAMASGEQRAASSERRRLQR